MNIESTHTPSPEAQRQLEALRRVVRKTLDRKRRLGQYAVVWKGGKVVTVGKDMPDRLKDMP